MIEQLIVLLTMIMFLKMAQFMKQDVVNAVHGSLYEPGIKYDQT